MEHCECGGDLHHYHGLFGYEALICVKCREHWCDTNVADHERHLERYRSGVRNSNDPMGDWLVQMSEGKASVRFADEIYSSHICRLDQSWLCDEHGLDVPKLAYLLAASPEMFAVCNRLANDEFGPFDNLEDAYKAFDELMKQARSAVNSAEARQCKCGRWYSKCDVYCLYCNNQTPWASEIARQFE